MITEEQQDTTFRRRSRTNRWLAREFTLGNLITIAVLLATAVSQWAILGTRVTSLEQHETVVEKRLDAHDRHFENLPHEYVPRSELQEDLANMKDDLRDIKSDLRSMEHDHR